MPNLRRLAAFAVIASSAVVLPAQAGAQVFVGWSVASSWSTGFQGDLVLTNNAAYTVYDWALEADFAPAITSIWNGSYTALAPPRKRFAGAQVSWDDGDLQPGETVTVSFIAASPPGPAPANLVLNGAPMILNASSPAPPPLAPAAAPPWPRRVASPYVDATAWPPFDFVAAADLHGQRFFNLAFVVATSPTDGAPSFGGYYPVSTSYLLPELNALRARGGDVMLSFGGAAGTDLAVAHATAASLQAAYQTTIDAYGLVRVDFDVEGAWLAHPASILRRSQALAGLQAAAAAAGKVLEVWFTLPVLPSGLTADGLNVLSSALTHGVAVAGVNIMTMDYGASAAPNPAGQMGSYAIQAATSLHGQLLALYAAHGAPLAPAAAWRKIGLTPMIGQNDVPGEIFTAADAAQVVAFAAQQDLPLLGFWSMNRDQPCPGGPSPWASGSCHSLTDPAWTFTDAFRAFTVGTWEALPGAVPGATGAPVLAGAGDLTGGAPFSLAVNGLPAIAVSSLVVGGFRLDLPVFGGLFVPTPDLLVPFAADAAGAWSVAGVWPLGVASGAALHMQAWAFDAGSASGYAASNGLSLRTP